jgi:hypothetical protein
MDVITVVSNHLGIVSFDRTFLVALHIDHTAVDINGYGFELTLIYVSHNFAWRAHATGPSTLVQAMCPY